jgi:aspartate kinase
MLHAAGIVQSSAQSGSVVVIVSAMRGVTDHLLSIGNALLEGKLPAAREFAEGVINTHLGVLRDLQLAEEDELRVRREMQLLCSLLLHDVNSTRPNAGNAELLDRLASYGERLSARLFAAALEKCDVVSVPVTASDFVLTCDTFRDARPDVMESRERGREILLPLLEDGIVPVVTGFIGATPDGRITTLGRNSSDFSGAIIAHVVDADELVIWTDVDGIFTANPRENQEAQLLHELSYDDAHALAKSGAKVLHAKVLPLAAETEMVVWVRNTFNPAARGTRIGPRADVVSSHDGGQS